MYIHDLRSRASRSTSAFFCPLRRRQSAQSGGIFSTAPRLPGYTLALADEHTRTHLEVAIGIAVRDGKVLISRRPAAATVGGFWEFPGGKCHAGETPSQCVVRELREETALSVSPLKALRPIDWPYSHGEVRLHPFICEVLQGEARALWADELRWVAPEDLRNYRFPPANDELIACLPELLAELRRHRR